MLSLAADDVNSVTSDTQCDTSTFGHVFQPALCFLVSTHLVEFSLLQREFDFCKFM
jgi:hypothetical protein